MGDRPTPRSPGPMSTDYPSSLPSFSLASRPGGPASCSTSQGEAVPKEGLCYGRGRGAQ